VSGVLILVLVAMWALLLVPMWLRRHDEVNQTRSVDRFTTAMRILSRQDRAAAGARSMVKPPLPGASLETRREWLPRLRQTAPMTGRARLLARRRRVFLTLVGVAFVTFVAAVFGALSFWWQAVADLALLAYAFHLRAEATRARSSRERRYETVEPPLAPAPARPAVPAAPVDLPPVSAGAEVVVEPVSAAAPDEAWEPTPVPLPTYVTAPVAPRPAVRILDDDLGLDVFGSEDEVADIVERSRVVNE
jgi:hypothetical protein